MAKKLEKEESDSRKNHGAKCTPTNESLPTGVESHSWLGEAIEGGLPQLLLGPAGKALSRLIAGAADIPAAWLEKQAERIRDEKRTRSTVMEGLAPALTQRAASDPSVLDRGLSRLIGELYRTQENREAIARLTVEHLSESAPPTDSAGPSDDWMNVFERHAEQASSEKIRETFASVLAGEIRKPGTFSLAILQFLSVLDQSLALKIEQMMPWVVDRYWLPEQFTAHIKFINAAALRDVGLIGQTDVDATVPYRIGDSGKLILNMSDVGLVFRGKPGTELRMNFISLSTVGQELCRVISHSANELAIEAVVSQAKKRNGLETIHRGVFSEESDRWQVRNLELIWQKPPES